MASCAEPLGRNAAREEITRGELQELVNHVNLRKGMIVITVHENQLAKIEISQTYVIQVWPPTSEQSNADATPLCLEGLEDFVKSRLVDRIRSAIGAFGSLTIPVNHRRIGGRWWYQISKK